MNILCRLAAILLLISNCASATAIGAEGKRIVLSDAQRKEVQEIIAQFRRVRGQQEQRLAGIERMQTLGPLGLKQLLDILQKELGKPVGDYRQAFYKG